MFAMLTLVLADNFLLMFVGWEGVGLCSYLLIGFWYEKPAAAEAGKKAFIVNRIGDFGFLLGMLPDASSRSGTPRLRARVRRGAPTCSALGASGDRHRDRAAAVPRRDRQERADPALRLAARRDGGPDAGLAR